MSKVPSKDIDSQNAGGISERPANISPTDIKSAQLVDYDSQLPMAAKHAKSSGQYDGAALAAQSVLQVSATRMNRINLAIASKYRHQKGEVINLNQVSVASMPDLEEVLVEMMTAHCISADNSEAVSNFLTALTVDVYVNSYSDKKTFDGEITINGFTLDLYIIGEIIKVRCGNNPRRFAKSFADTAIRIMRDNELFREILQKRADEYNITSSDAIYLFDGAEGALIGRAAEIRLATARKEKLSNADKSTSVQATSSVPAGIIKSNTTMPSMI